MRILIEIVILVTFILKCKSDAIVSKNCSYFSEVTKKNEFKLCQNELVCCENPLLENNVCCNPPEYQNWHAVLPVQLTLRNIIFIVFIFFGVIVIGATIITFLMGISYFMEKQKLYKPVFIYNPVNSRDIIQVPVEYQRSPGSFLSA
ncbi:unnamed protein product [Brachionus calyciflorus]|uniref:Uncharacterized protein n=1 Tax=Brachionus calyciflorus TaxID=104777 RepID=A0A813MWZ8_9BILA|nr:unnamed protein product [Brachionus calyciflorus]